MQNAFLDALSIQADRIRENIKKKYTISDEELSNLMFGESQSLTVLISVEK